MGGAAKAGPNDKGTADGAGRRGMSGGVVVSSGPSTGGGFASGAAKLTTGAAPFGAAGNVSVRGGDGIYGGGVSIRAGLSNISKASTSSANAPNAPKAFTLGSGVDITSGRVVGPGSAPVDGSSGHVTIATGSAGRATASGSVSVATGSASTARHRRSCADEDWSCK